MRDKKELPRINPSQPIAIDTENCDPELKTLAPGYICNVGFVAGVAIAAKEGSFYIPINHTEGENYRQEDVVEWLNDILSGDSDKIFHNAQYDLGWLSHIGVQIHGRLFDTMLAAALLDENKRNYSLDAVGKEYLNEGKNETALIAAVQAKFAATKTHKSIIRIKEDISYDYKPWFDAKTRICPFYDLWPKEVQEKYTLLGNHIDGRGTSLFKVPTKADKDIKGLLWAVDPIEMGSYPIQDVDLTYRLYYKFKELLSSEGLTEVMELENELSPCLLEMREQGVRIDMNGAIKLDKQYTEDIAKVQSELDNMCGTHIDVNIDDDLIQICNTFNLEYARTAKGNPCFSAEAVPDHPAFAHVLELRKLAKARDTYCRGYFFGSAINDRLHGQYNQLKSDEGGTVTGRLSSSNPNLQNIPNPEKSVIGKQMRSLFLPDNDNEQWLCMDFSGQEPKMLVNLVLLLDSKFGVRQVKDMTTGEITLLKEEGFPGADLARTPEFASREANFHLAVAKQCMIKQNQHQGVTVTEEELMAQAKAFRGKAKSIGLGIMYGSGDKKIAEEMTKKGSPMTVAEASELRASVYAGVPFLDAINKYVMNLAKRRGYVLTLLKRRGRFEHWEIPVYGIKRDSYTPLLFKTREEALKWTRTDDCIRFKAAHPNGELGSPQRAFTYKALNKIIQGSSADQTKTAMLHLYKRNNMDVPSLDIYYRRAPFDPPKSRTQVHDEMNFSVDPSEDIQWYQDTMENSLPLLVESVAEPGLGHNWAEAK